VFVAVFAIVFGRLDRIRKALEKNEFDKALELIEKAYEKEPKNAGISYFKAVLYNNTSFPGNHPDTARLAIEKSRIDFRIMNTEDLEDIKEDGITIDKIDSVHNQIKNQFLFNALRDVNRNSIKAFRIRYPDSEFEELFEFKIDSIAFQEAKAEYTMASFKQYSDERPTSIYAPIADSLYQELRFKALQNGSELEEYYHFLREFPLSRHRSNIESWILVNTTLKHDPDEYWDFLKIAREDSLLKQVLDILFYLNPEDPTIYRNHPDTDSLREAYANMDRLIFPIVSEDGIGFESVDGAISVAPFWDEITSELRCQLSNDNWVFVKKGQNGYIIDKTGHLILKNVSGFENIGKDVAMVETNRQKYLYHKSGYRIIKEPVQDASLLQDRWLKVKKNDKWGLSSYLGFELTKFDYDDIYIIGGLWAFKKNGKIALETTEYLLRNLNKNGLLLEFKFDDIEFIDDDKILGFKDDKESMLDTTLNFLIPWGKYEIIPNAAGWYIKTDKGYLVYNDTREEVFNNYFSYLELNLGWIALKTDIDWMLIPKTSDILPSRGYDSIKLVNYYAALTFANDLPELFFSSGKKVIIINQLD
jgi:hypothetical protein